MVPQGQLRRKLSLMRQRLGDVEDALEDSRQLLWSHSDRADHLDHSETLSRSPPRSPISLSMV